MRKLFGNILGNERGDAKVIAVGVLAVLVVCIIIFIGLAGVEHVKGHQLAVKETWTGGVIDNVFVPKKYIYFRPTTDYIVYDMRVQNFIMNNLTHGDGEVNSGRDLDAYELQVGKGAQKVVISLSVRWHYNPDLLLTVHKIARNNPRVMEEKVIRNNMMRVVKDNATVQEALDIYSGVGLVKLQKDIGSKLKDLAEFHEKGVIIDGFVIERIDLDPKYEAEIALKQVAIQKALRMKKEEEANNAEAGAKEAFAMIAKKEAIVAAQKDKEVGILAKEQAKQERILQAEAEKQEQVLSAQGKAAADTAKAKGILKRGIAEAKVEKAKRDAMYAGVAGERRASVEIAEARVTMFKNLKTVLPEKVAMTLIDASLASGIKGLNMNAAGQ